MKLIVGLGNPGKQYEKTRHNVGFMVLDFLANKAKWNDNKKAKALYLKTEINSQPVELVKPQTFMNNSGLAVTHELKNSNLSPDYLIVIHDDKDLPLGQIKVQKNVGPAGHNGVKSIIEHLGTQDFTRFRIGIASDNPRKMSDTAKFVLNKFSLLEKPKLKKILEQAKEEVVKLI